MKIEKIHIILIIIVFVIVLCYCNNVQNEGFESSPSTTPSVIENSPQSDSKNSDRLEKSRMEDKLEKEKIADEQKRIIINYAIGFGVFLIIFFGSIYTFPIIYEKYYLKK
jgi:hypothetical protein